MLYVGVMCIQTQYVAVLHTSLCVPGIVASCDLPPEFVFGTDYFKVGYFIEDCFGTRQLSQV